MDDRVKKTLPFAITALAIGAVTYMVHRTYSAINKLDKLDLDFGNDEGLLSMFNRKDKL